MKIVPIGDNIVVKRLEADVTTAGGIVLPDSAQRKPMQGRVLSTGDGRLLADGTRVAHQVREGDKVVFGNWVGNELRINDEELLVISEGDILAILD